MTNDPMNGSFELHRNFSSISLHDWRQYYSVQITFHRRLTVITGANGCGKSTILNILGRHFNWNKSFSSEPVDDDNLARGWRNTRRSGFNSDGSTVDIGAITYGTNTSTPIRIPQSGANDSRMDYSVELPTQQHVDGVYLPSHRSIPGNYAPVTEIPTSFADSGSLLEQFTNDIRTTWLGGYTGRSPRVTFKQALISAAVFGNPGNEYVDVTPEAQEIWSGFRAILEQVMPQSIGFLAVRIRLPDVILETRSGNFIIDEASGGVSAVLEIAWQIYLRSRTHDQFTVIIDEPENHLHPSLQREIMPSLLRAFPGVQFIVATHSPFLVTSTRDSAVYALDFNSNRSVESRELDYVNKAASANETLQNVLGVPSVFPTWAERDFARIVDKHTRNPITKQTIVELRDELRENGMATQYPEAVIKLLDKQDPEAGQ